MDGKRIFFSIMLTLAAIGCGKTASHSKVVSIRFVNSTSGNFSKFQLNTTDFGAISQGDTTSYRGCTNIYPEPFANDIAINDVSTYILDIFPTPYLNGGKYLLQIRADSSSLRYVASFIKE